MARGAARHGGGQALTATSTRARDAAIQTTRCPKCDGKMEPGFPLDATYGGVCEAKWVPGTPEKSFWTGLKIERDKLLSIVSMRCTRCGFLENYAPPPAAQ